jgi:hypothetical protein
MIYRAKFSLCDIRRNWRESRKPPARPRARPAAATAKSLSERPVRASPNPRRQRRSGWSWWHLLLLVPFVAVLWPPFYNKAAPTFIGLPFFYWYQLAWIIIGAALTAIVYLATDE